MENLSFKVDRRTETGKGANRRLRQSGLVPGVVYGIHDSTPLSVDPKGLEQLLSTRAGANVIFQLNVAGEKKSERPVIVKELQRDPMQGNILHADFLEIRMDQKITVSIPVNLTGESPGVKIGGTLSQLLRELEVACLPNAIPEEIVVDISQVNMNDVIHVRDLSIPADVDLITDPEDPVLTVMAPVEEEEEVVEEGAEAAPEGEGAEGEAAASAEGAAESAESSEEKS